MKVTPHAGVWIETPLSRYYTKHFVSLPTRECGLKHSSHNVRSLPMKVTPHAGVWIETSWSTITK